MFATFEDALHAFDQHLGVGELNALQRGVEREMLRIADDGNIAATDHPKSLGSALTHSLITTDYSESLLELITPVHTKVRDVMDTLSDVHRYVARNLPDGELLWPLSMPCYVKDEETIRLAEYGSSNAGQMRTLYRKGLKKRYGSLMQVIAGVHYNFSLPDSFWPKWQAAVGDNGVQQDFVSRSYLGMVRNFRRHSWILPYLFGASPAVCQSFLAGRQTHLPLDKQFRGTLSMPFATTLRMSDLGYTNSDQASLGISYNTLEEYVASVRRACNTPSESFAEYGVKDSQGDWQQLNTNVLQIENELYAPIRPKRVIQSGQHPSDALEQGGVQYLEVRSLDVNPFSPVGISSEQIRFMDLLLLWCLLQPSPELDDDGEALAAANLNKVVLQGRDPALRLSHHGQQRSIADWGAELISQLRPIADKLDCCRQQQVYAPVLDEIATWFAEPQKTLSGQLTHAMNSTEQDQSLFALGLAYVYRSQLAEGPYKLLSEAELVREAEHSLQRQSQQEAADNKTFDQYIADYFSR